jgi:hypothetical protein
MFETLTDSFFFLLHLQNEIHYFFILHSIENLDHSACSYESNVNHQQSNVTDFYSGCYATYFHLLFNTSMTKAVSMHDILIYRYIRQ